MQIAEKTYHPDLDKLRNLVHYVCDAAPNPKQLGKTKLHKILYYSDFEAYLMLGEPITGETYIKMQYGPMSTHAEEVVKTLEEMEQLKVARAFASGFFADADDAYVQTMYYSLAKPDISIFSGPEISIVDRNIHVICTQHTARSISERSHDLIWELADFGEPIPYHAAFLRTLRPATPGDLEWAAEQLRSR